MKEMHFDSKIKQCKRIAGAETESAMLFRTYRDDDGSPKVQIRVLAHSKGDEIYIRKDQYENIISAAWGYYVREEKDELVYHFDIYTRDVIYHCAKRAIGWDVVEETNFIGKIPLILFGRTRNGKGLKG